MHRGSFALFDIPGFYSTHLLIYFGGSKVFVALGQENGTFNSFKVAKSTSFTVFQGWDNYEKNPRHVADVNGDDRADIISFGDNVVVVALGQENGTFDSNISAISNFTPGQGWANLNQYPRQVADVNGDGCADIIGFGGNKVFVALEQENGTFNSFKVAKSTSFTMAQGWDNYEKNPRQVADVNSDGRADIIGFGDNNVAVALGQTNGTFGGNINAITNFTPGAGGWSNFESRPRQVADVNADGRADIVGFGINKIVVALGQTDGTFDVINYNTFGSDLFNLGDWNSFNQNPRHIADVTGDGKADVIAFGANTVYVEDDLISSGIITDRITDFNGNQGDKLVISKDQFGINSLGDLNWSFDNFK